MRKLALRVVLLALSLLLGVPQASAQSINSGTVTGTLLDQSGAVINAAKVTLRNPVTGYEQSMVTDNAGSFRFNNVP